MKKKFNVGLRLACWYDGIEANDQKEAIEIATEYFRGVLPEIVEVEEEEDELA